MRKQKRYQATEKPRIKRGDTVIVTKGKDRGKTGLVKLVLKERSQVLVENVNKVKKTVKSVYSSEGFVEVEKPIHLSNVMYFDTSTETASRLSFTNEGDKKVRVLVKSQKIISED